MRVWVLSAVMAVGAGAAWAQAPAQGEAPAQIVQQKVEARPVVNPALKSLKPIEGRAPRGLSKNLSGQTLGGRVAQGQNGMVSQWIKMTRRAVGSVSRASQRRGQGAAGRGKGKGGPRDFGAMRERVRRSGAMERGQRGQQRAAQSPNARQLRDIRKGMRHELKPQMQGMHPPQSGADVQGASPTE